MPGIRFIAIFEFIKGLGALIVTIGVYDVQKKKHLFLIHDFLNHVYPPSLKQLAKFSVAKVELLSNHEAKLVLAFGILYAGLRIAEGYGLWARHNWGRYVGIWSALLYLPFEFYEIFTDFSVFKIIVTLINIGVVGYLWKTHF